MGLQCGFLPQQSLGHFFEYPLVTQKITYQNLATVVRASKTNSYFLLLSGTQVTSVLIKHGKYGLIEDVTVTGQHMLKLQDIVAGKLQIEMIKRKNLDLFKKNIPELHISLESRAKNVTDLEKKVKMELFDCKDQATYTQ